MFRSIRVWCVYVFQGLNDLAKLAIVDFLIAQNRFDDDMDNVETFSSSSIISSQQISVFIQAESLIKLK